MNRGDWWLHSVGSKRDGHDLVTKCSRAHSAQIILFTSCLPDWRYLQEALSGGGFRKQNVGP